MYLYQYSQWNMGGCTLEMVESGILFNLGLN